MELAQKKATRIVRDLTSFHDAGDKMLQLVSGLHSSRVAAYGYVLEAESTGVTRYKVTEQLDVRTCPICRLTHGMTFDVSDARTLLDNVLYETNPDLLRTMQPWPSQSKANVEAFSRMSEEEMVSRNWHIPPYHPRCRGLLVEVETEIPMFDTTFTNEDFAKAGISVRDPKNVEVYNRSPFQATPQEIFEAFAVRFTDPVFEFGAAETAVGGYSLSVLVRGEEGYLSRILRLDPDGELIAHHTGFELKPEYQGQGIAKAILADQIAFYEEQSVSSVNLTANINVGSYAWAKYGFVPVGGTDALANNLKSKLATAVAANKNFFAGWTAPEIAQVESLLRQLGDGDAQAITLLADIAKPVSTNIPLGKWLLQNEAWRGALDLNDPDAMLRFNHYVGRSP
jgi:GNAT superfamily N-acetyltransferase